MKKDLFELSGEKRFKIEYYQHLYDSKDREVHKNDGTMANKFM